jgi:O-antigen/teichoic acid export membrane protein
MSVAVNTFWRHVGVVLSGTAAAQAIPVLGSLVIARLYAPAEFGIFATWFGVATLASTALTGRYEMALALEPDGEQRRFGMIATVSFTLASGALLLVVAGIVLLLSPGWLHGFPVMLCAIFAPTAVAIAVARTWQCWAAADGSYTELSFMRLAQAFCVTFLQIVVGMKLPSATALGIAYAIGVLLGVGIAAWRLPLGSLPKLARLRQFFLTHRRFPQMSVPADCVNVAAAQLPLLIVASRFGAEVAGLLALAFRTMGAPIALLGASVLDVFRRDAALSYRERGECQKEYFQTFKVLSLGALLASVPMGLFCEPLFAYAFGESWRGAGVMAGWLMPMFALRFVASPLSYMFYVAEKQHVDLMWQLGLLAMTFATLTLPSQYSIALLWYSGGYSAMYVVYLALSYRFSRPARVRVGALANDVSTRV